MTETEAHKALALGCLAFLGLLVHPLVGAFFGLLAGLHTLRCIRRFRDEITARRRSKA